ncbi:hypothetical protein [Acidimangrovimonas sediminis]|uniref:hypothetical protein n=1 Tax=Acidimangrovimonas sediminis TaxID=2056283 RepID=UPI000C805438|nr:hypothetical protein [Acidimangrovimonas sediminis]
MHRTYPVLFILIVALVSGGIYLLNGDGSDKAVAAPAAQGKAAPGIVAPGRTPAGVPAAATPPAAAAPRVCIRRGGTLDCPKG